MIKFENLTKKFGKKIAVNNLNFDIQEGKVYGFLGPNGAGKSTTIKMLVGILSIDEGNIIVDNLSVKNNAYEVKKLISYVPDNPDIYEKLSAKQYLNFIADIYGLDKKIRDERIYKYAKLFEIDKDLDGLIGSFSHGMRQKVCLISSFIHNPKIMVLDEPMVGLDPKSSFTLKQLMKEHCQKGGIVFFSTHVMEVAEKICDKLIIINKGKILADTTIEELREIAGERSLEDIFLEMTNERVD